MNSEGPPTTHQLTTRRGVRRLAQDPVVDSEIKRAVSGGADIFEALSTTLGTIHRAWKTWRPGYGNRRRQHARANAKKELRKLAAKSTRHEERLRSLRESVEMDAGASMYWAYWGGRVSTPEEELELEQRRNLIATAMAELPELEKQVLMGYLLGRTWSDIVSVQRIAYARAAR